MEKKDEVVCESEERKWLFVCLLRFSFLWCGDVWWVKDGGVQSFVRPLGMVQLQRKARHFGGWRTG